MSRYAVLLTLIICALVPALAPAETFTVPGDYPTIQEAIDATMYDDSGHTIVVSPGTYDGWIDVWGRHLPSIVSTNPDDPTVVASTIIRGGFRVDCGGGDHPPSIIQISGFTIKIGGIRYLDNAMRQATLVASNNVLDGCFGGIDFNQIEGEATAWILNNTISGSSVGISHNPYNEMNLHVVGNTISDCLIGLKGEFRNVIGNTIVNNIECGAELPLVDEFAYNHVAHNRGTGVIVGCAMHWPAPNSVHNNAIVDNGVGLFLKKDAIADSNTIVVNRQAGVVLGDETEQTLRNSIIYGNGVAVEDPAGLGIISYCCSNVSLPGEGNIVCDPRFVDPASGDYHLTELSPCINRGTPDYDWQISTTDFDEDLRVRVDRIDIGADETPYDTPPLIGDMNGDGTLNGLDIQLFVEAITGL